MNAFWLAVVTACIWGVVPILEKAGLSKTDPMVALFYRCLGVIVGLLLLSLFIVRPEQIRSVNAKSIFLLVLAGFLASFVAQITFYYGLKLGEVSRVVPISSTYHLIAVMLGILIFKEGVTLAKIVGASLIFAGAWLLK